MEFELLLEFDQRQQMKEEGATIQERLTGQYLLATILEYFTSWDVFLNI